MLAALTDPPYWIRTWVASSSPTWAATTPRIHAQASWASPGVAAWPVPMAQTGS